MKRNLIYIVFLSFFSISAMAAEGEATGEVQTSVTENKSFFKTIRENLSAMYIFETTGPSLEALDGVKDEGHQLNFTQYIILGYKLGEKTRLGLTQYFSNSIRSKSEGRNLSLGSPYLTLSHSSLFEKGKLNVSGYVRYYVPLSRTDAANAGKERDEKNGKLRFHIKPSAQLNDVISVSGSMNFYKPLSRYGLREGDKRRNFYLWVFPAVSFKVSDKFTPYIAYSNLFTRYSDIQDQGAESAWDAWSKNESLEIGATWKVMDKLTVSPYINFNAPKWINPSATNLSFYATYTFL